MATTHERWNSIELSQFEKAVQSLKLYRRAELAEGDGGNKLIEDLYTDPLPNDHVFRTMMQPNTTFLIGRKGTGKSTVFQRCQHEIRKSKDTISAYIDIKTLYEGADLNLSAVNLVGNTEAHELANRLALYREFVVSIVKDIHDELGKGTKKSVAQKLAGKFKRGKPSVQDQLKHILQDAKKAKFDDVSISQVVERARTQSTETKRSANGGVSVNAVGPSLNIGASAEAIHGSTDAQIFTQLLMRVFNVQEFISRVKDVLDEIGVNRLYVFLDDFSELPAEAMEVVVDSLLAPLNNWSDELVKFKVAAYPGRVYYGAIDPAKIDEIHLDIYELYGASDVTDMEEKAVDFTRRLVTRRIEHYCDTSPSTFLEGLDGEFWRDLFFAAMGNPRILGYLLFFVYRDHMIYGKKPGRSAIAEAAVSYFENKIQTFFTYNKFLQMSFGEKSSAYGLKSLIESLVARAWELRRDRPGILDKVDGRAHTSHFYVDSSMESLISTLELNFFVTKYYENSDKDGRKVSVYALNYGLCNKFNIRYGRPVGEREFRNYFRERPFDYTPIIQAYVRANQRIVCNSCGVEHDFDMLETIKTFSMLCPTCKQGTCDVINSSEEYSKILKEIDENLLLPSAELGIMQALHSESIDDPDARPRAQEIGQLIDRSYQLVGSKAKNLNERGLIDRKYNSQGYRIYELTETAINAYFSKNDADSVKIEDGEPVAD